MLQVKRLAVLVSSGAAGLAITLGLLALIGLLQRKVTLAGFGYDYLFLTAALFGIVVMIWLDHFMKTKIFPE